MAHPSARSDLDRDSRCRAGAALGDMRHRSVWRGSVPVFLTGRNPDDISWPALLDRATDRLEQRIDAIGGP